MEYPLPRQADRELGQFPSNANQFKQRDLPGQRFVKICDRELHGTGSCVIASNDCAEH